MESKSEAAASLPDDSPESEANRHYPAWVGCVMAIFLPGSAHFLAGQRRFGILCWPILLFGQLLLVAVAGIPGAIFLYAAIILAALCLFYYLAVIVSSRRPTRRIGCLGWLLFPVLVLGLNYVVSLPCALFLKTYVYGSLRHHGRIHVADNDRPFGRGRRETRGPVFGSRLKKSQSRCLRV